MTRSAKKTASFLAAHAAPLPAHVTRESVLATLHAMPNLAARASAIAPNASHESHHDSDGRALFTVTRPRVLDRDGLFQLHLCDGRLVAAFARVPTIRGAFDSVIGYLAQALPADCDPAAEVESYRASFRDNWEGDLAASAYPTFKASALTRAARWAFRLAAAEAEAKARAETEGDCLCLLCFKRFDLGPHDVQICPACHPAERAEAEARAKAWAEDAPAQIAAFYDAVEAEDDGQDRESYSDDQDRESYSAEPAAPAEVVDVTPTWAAVARIIELGLVHGNATGRQIAREELARMAAIADSAVAAAKLATPAAEVEKRGDAAESIADEMTRSAVRNCLGAEFKAPSPATRAYTTDSGVVTCTATFGGDSVRVAWDCDGVPTSRAGAELLIRNRMARVAQGR